MSTGVPNRRQAAFSGLVARSTSGRDAATIGTVAIQTSSVEFISEGKHRSGTRATKAAALATRRAAAMCLGNQSCVLSHSRACNTLRHSSLDSQAGRRLDLAEGDRDGDAVPHAFFLAVARLAWRWSAARRLHRDVCDVATQLSLLHDLDADAETALKTAVTRDR
jgi:hypothetical protein